MVDSHHLRILIFGAAGQLGTDCLNRLQQSYECIGLTRAEVDFSDTESVVESVKSYRPNIVVNACAYTAVDKAESDQVVADQVNHLSVLALATACESIGSVLIHVSTDYVFDGRSDIPYVETDPVNPLTVYGQTKQLGEAAIEATLTQYVILRTSWVFGENGNNFVKTMLKVGADRDTLSVVNDQLGRPTYVGHIVDVIVGFVQRYQQQESIDWGIYHCSSSGSVSWYDFARAIFDHAYETGHFDKLVHVDPISSSAYPTPAPRPQYSIMDTAKLENLFDQKMPSWQSGLSAFFSNIKTS